MATSKKSNSTKRFGPRYGKTVKDKVAKIEATQRANHKCPNCSRDRVTRLSLGIWYCGKCGNKFAGKAYTVSKQEKLQSVVEEL